MGASFDAGCDVFDVASRRFFTWDMSMERDTVLGFFDRSRKELPTLTKFRPRDDGVLTLEEEEPPGGGSRRWVRLEPGSLRFGHFAPPDTSTGRRSTPAAPTACSWR